MSMTRTSAVVAFLIMHYYRGVIWSGLSNNQDSRKLFLFQKYVQKHIFSFYVSKIFLVKDIFFKQQTVVQFI